MLLVCLAQTVYALFAGDDALPLHDNLIVSVYSHSDRDYVAYSTTDGLKDESPFAGTCQGVFAVIQSSCMRHIPDWPSLSAVHLATCLQDSLRFLDEAKLIHCLEEGSLIVWSTSHDDLLMQCENVRDCIRYAKQITTRSSAQVHDQYAVDYAPYIDSGAWYGEPNLGQLNGLDSVQEPFLGGFSDSRLQENYGEPCFYSVLFEEMPGHIEQEHKLTDQKPLLNIPITDSGVSVATALSPITLTPSSLSEASRLAPSPFSSPLSQTPTPQSSPSYLVSTIQEQDTIMASSPSTVCPRDVYQDFYPDGPHTLEEYVEHLIISDIVPSPETEGVPSSMLEFNANIPPLESYLGGSVHTDTMGLSMTPSATPCMEVGPVRKQRRVTTTCRMSPYQLLSRRSPCPAQGSSSSDSSDFDNTTSQADEEHRPEEDGSRDRSGKAGVIKRRRQYKRRKSTKKCFRCKLCSDSFSREADVDRHLKSCTRNPDRESKKACDYCGKGLPVRNDARDRHWKSASCLAEANRRGVWNNPQFW